MKKSLAIFLIFFVGVQITFRSASAQDSLHVGRVWQQSQWQVAYRVAVRDSYAFVAAEYSGLRILNIANPAAPVEIGYYDTPEYAWGVVVRGNYAYVSDREDGLRIVNISNPACPVESGSYDTFNNLRSLAIQGNYAYLCDDNQGLVIVNISNPASPVQVGSYSVSAYGIAVDGSYAYVAGGNSLKILNVSNPANPILTGTYSISYTSVYGVAVSGNYAYVATDTHGLHIVDISDPATPTEVGIGSMPGFSTLNGIPSIDVTINGSYAFVATLSDGLRIFDISNPAAPFQAGYYDTPGTNRGVAVSGGYAYLADDWNGLRVLDISNPASPIETGFYNTPGDAFGVARSGNYAYVADGTSGLKIYDTSNPTTAIQVGAYNTPGYALKVAISGSYAYVADYGSGLRVINVNNPASPVETGFYDTPGSAMDVAVSGSYAYVSDYYSVKILNISNPANPILTGSCNVPSTSNGITVVGSYAYVAASAAGLRIINISNPTAPVEVGFYRNILSASKDVAVSGDYAYLADYSSLRIINVANPASPVLAASLELHYNPLAVAVDGSFAYVADDDGGLRVVNISNPTNPTEVGYYDTRGNAGDVVVADSLAYVADQAYFTIYDCRPALMHLVSVVSPNGRERWYEGDTMRISWTTLNPSGLVALEINRDFPAGTWLPIAVVAASAGGFNWLVTGPETGRASVRATSIDFPEGTDHSDTTFTVVGRTITLVSPAGGERWFAGDSARIIWTAQNVVGSTAIDIARDFPSGPWQRLAIVSVSAGGFDWRVSGPRTHAARIRLSSLSVPSVVDVSDSNFSVEEPQIGLLAPQGGEVWTSGETREIRWNSRDVSGNFEIEVNYDYPSSGWTQIIAGAPDSGRYSWLVPPHATSSAAVRVMSIAHPSAGDTSDAPFRIRLANQPPTLCHDRLHDQFTGTFDVTALITDDVPDFVAKAFIQRAGTAHTDSTILTGTGNGDEYSATLGPLTNGVYKYILRAVDVDGATATTDTLVFSVGDSLGSQMTWDDGTAEWFNWAESDSGLGMRWAVKFGPVQTPYAVCEAWFAASGDLPSVAHGPVTVSVLAADGENGMPGTVLWSDTRGSVGNKIGGMTAGACWVPVVIRNSLNSPLLVNTPQFYVAVSNTTPGKASAIGRDANGARAERSVLYDACLGRWISEEDTLADKNAMPGNRMIRAQGYALTSPTVVIQRTGTAVRLNWSRTGAPLYHVYSDSTFRGSFLTLTGTTADTTMIDSSALSSPQNTRFYRVNSYVP